MPMTLEVPEPLASRLAAAADAQGVSAERIALDTLSARFGQPRRRLSFAAIGASTSGRRAADAEQPLAEEDFGIHNADR